jgi:hypothetical protein
MKKHTKKSEQYVTSDLKKIQAFPSTGYESENILENGWMGMTLRDYFAASAMQGVISSCYMKRNTDFTESLDLADDAEFVAEISYEMADAMLLQRTKG